MVVVQSARFLGVVPFWVPNIGSTKQNLSYTTVAARHHQSTTAIIIRFFFCFVIWCNFFWWSSKTSLNSTLLFSPSCRNYELFEQLSLARSFSLPLPRPTQKSWAQSSHNFGTSLKNIQRNKKNRENHFYKEEEDEEASVHFSKISPIFQNP